MLLDHSGKKRAEIYGGLSDNFFSERLQWTFKIGLLHKSKLSSFYSCTPLPQVSPDSLMPTNLRGTIDGFSGLLSREGIVSHWVHLRLHHIFMCCFLQLFVTQLLCTEIICRQAFSQVDKKKFNKNIFSNRQLQSCIRYFWSVCLPVCICLYTCLCIDDLFVFIYRGDLSPSIFVFFSMYLLLSVIQQFKSCSGP